MLHWVRRAIFGLGLWVAAASNASADNWLAIAPGEHYFGDGISAALYSAKATYSCYSDETCHIVWCKNLYDVQGRLTTAECFGQTNGAGFARPGYATLQCDEDEIRTHDGCVDKPIERQLTRVDAAAQCFQNGTTSTVGNPIDARARDKLERVTDFEAVGGYPFSFNRTYISSLNFYGGLGVFSRLGLFWRSNFDANAFYFGDPVGTPARVHITLPSGQEYVFVSVSGSYQLAYFDWPTKSWKTPRKGDFGQLVKSGSEFDFTGNDDITYAFDFSGHLIRISNPRGYHQDLAYNTDGQNTTVTDSLGRTITFTYNAQNLVTSMQTPDGQITKFEYVQTVDLAALFAAQGVTYPADLEHENWALQKVIYPDNTPATDADNPTVAYAYTDSAHPGSLTNITDERGVSYATFTYAANGNAASTRIATDTNTYTLTYDDAANTATALNALGKSTIYHFENDGQSQRRLTRIEGVAFPPNCAAADTVYSYDASNYVSQIEDGEHHITKFNSNDSRGRPASVTEAFGTTVERTTSYVWDSTYNLPSTVTQDGLRTDYTYYSGALLHTITQTDTTTQSVPYSTNGQTRVWTFSYTAEGLLHTIDGPLTDVSDVTTYDYDAVTHKLSQVTNALGQVTVIVSMNGRDLPTEVRDPNGTTITFGYDPRGRVTTITTNPGTSQAVWSIEYDLAGDITKITSPSGAYLAYAYNDARFVRSITNNSGDKISFLYNGLGEVRAINVANSAGAVTINKNIFYDELGRVLRLVGADNQRYTFTHNRVDEPTSLNDPRSKLYGFAFDALKRLMTETDPNSNQTTIAYNARDQVTSVTDARSLVTGYVRDGFGDVIRQTSPDSGTTDFWYDPAGRLKKILDARNVETDITYDANGRPLKRIFPIAGGETVTYTYDQTGGGNRGIGHLTKIDVGPEVTSFTYNRLGQVTRERRVIQGVTYDMNYTYDPAGNVLTAAYPSGRIVTFTRNTNGRVSAIAMQDTAGGPVINVATTIAYSPFGPVSNIAFGNGVLTTIGYNRDGRIATIQTANGATTIQNLSYGYDDALNLTSITDSFDASRSEAFSFDNLNRLKTATGYYGSISYTYDAVGNRLTGVRLGGAETYTVSPTSNRVTAVTTGTSVRNIAYLASGQVSSDDRGVGAVYAYTYNNEGRLKNVKLNGAITDTYRYNGLDQRVVTESGPGTTHYLFDHRGHLLSESDGTGTPLREYVWLDDLPIAMVDHTVAGNGLFFIHTDQVGRPQKMTTAADGSIIWDAIFLPFGEVYTKFGPATNQLRFPGQFSELAQYLHQNWYRDYDASLGRYIESDPVGLAGGINTYGYAANNPFRYTDPKGLVGFGVVVGGTAVGGVGTIPVAPETNISGGATASAGVGGFLDFSHNWYAPLSSSGAFTSFGRMTNVFGKTTGFPAGCQTRWALGAFAGGGGGFFLTNADTVRDLRGPFDTYSVDLLVASVQFGTSNGTWIVSITGGAGWPVGAASGYPTNTRVDGPYPDYTGIHGGGW